MKISPTVIEILTINKWSSKVYRFQKRDVDHLVERLVEEWSRFDRKIISAAVTQWQAHLRACVKVDGGHFEHFLWQLHWFIGHNCERVVHIVTKICVLTCNRKHVA